MPFKSTTESNYQTCVLRSLFFFSRYVSWTLSQEDVTIVLLNTRLLCVQRAARKEKRKRKKEHPACTAEREHSGSFRQSRSQREDICTSLASNRDGTKWIFFFFWRLRGALRWNSAEGTQILYVCELLKTGTFVQYVLCLKYTCTVFIWLCVYSMFTLIFFNVCFFYLLYYASSYSLLKCSSFPRGEHYFFYTVSTQLCLPFNF